jgi:hypothetical protein
MHWKLDNQRKDDTNYKLLYCQEHEQLYKYRSNANLKAKINDYPYTRI